MTVKNKDWKTTILIFAMATAVILAIVSTVIYTMRDKSRPGGIEEKLRLGQKYLSELDYDSAIAVFEDVIEIDDRNTEAYAGLGDAFTGKKEWTSAVKSYDNAVRTLAETSLDNETEYTEERLLTAFSDGSVRPVSGVLTEELDESYVLKINENRVNAIESGLAQIYAEGGGSEEMEEWLDETGHSDYAPRDKEIASVFTQSAETKESKTDIDETVHPYSTVINELTDRYGALRMAQTENDGIETKEANGLCYLNLVDFTRDGENELIAVCKNENEDHYSCFIYQMKDGNPELIFNDDEIEYDEGFGCENVYLSFCNETGYVIGKGWESGDADDMTFFWYKDGQFKPVYRYKGYWDGEKGDDVIDEESILVDLFDDAHREEVYANRAVTTLRTNGGYDADDDDFDLHKLQKVIDDTCETLGLKTDIEHKSTADASVYDAIIEEYREAMNGNESLYKESFNDEDAFKSVYPHVCAFAPTVVYGTGLDLKYAYYDIDGNGSMELLIGGDYDTPCVLDIITYDGNAAHGCFTDEWIGERNSLYIYKDGTIRYHGSGGATFHTEDLYRLSSNGYDLELINHYEVDWESYSDAVYYDGEKYLTPEEFNKITEELGYISPEWFSFLENR